MEAGVWQLIIKEIQELRASGHTIDCAKIAEGMQLTLISIGTLREGSLFDSSPVIDFDFPNIISNTTAMALPTNEQHHEEGSYHERPLHEIFNEAKLIHKKIEDGDVDAKSNIPYALRLLADSDRRVRSLALFSGNETIDDISTQNLSYLLIPALIGDLLVASEGMEGRLQRMQTAKEHYNAFLESCRVLECLQSEDQDVLDAVSPGSPGRMRSAKIAAYKREKETKQKLHEITEKMAHARMSSAPGDEEIEYEDEELVRAMTMTLIDLYVHKSVDSLSFIPRELEMLEFMAKRAADGKSQEPLPPYKPTPIKPLILARDAVQAAVLGAGYPSVPTMSIDEYLAKEFAMGSMIQGGGPTAKNPAKERDDDFGVTRYGADGRKLNVAEEGQVGDRDSDDHEDETEEEEEERLRKERSMDDYKDTHKRGYGNMYRRG